MLDFTKMGKKLVGVENVRDFGRLGTRTFYMILYNKYKVSVDCYQQQKFFHATVTLKNKKGELLYAGVTNEKGYESLRNRKAEELVVYACLEAQRLNTPKPKPDILDL